MALSRKERPRSFTAGSVVVVHPGVQHSRELVRALYEGGLLQCFFTSSNGQFCEARWLPAGIRERLRKRVTRGVPADMVTTIPLIEGITLAMTGIAAAPLRERISYASLAVFDRLIAPRVASLRPRIVIGMENCSRQVFRRAKAAGAFCVLDAASVHHAAQPPPASDVDARLRQIINARKDEEMRLADHVVVLSAYARDSYAAAGVPGEKISVIPPGVWLPDSVTSRPSRSGRAGIRFLFAGNVSRAKGVDLLLGAFARLEDPDKQLFIAGTLVEPGVLPKPLPEGVTYLGKLDRSALFSAYADADILVLPSRADGFGFVVAEAMASGLPVIVSSAVGAKDLVGGQDAGWIFETGSEGDLLSAMARAAARRNELGVIGSRARDAAAGLTWTAYGERIRALYRQLLEQTTVLSCQ